MSMMHRVKHGETNKKVVGRKESLKHRGLEDVFLEFLDRGLLGSFEISTVKQISVKKEDEIEG